MTLFSVAVDVAARAPIRVRPRHGRVETETVRESAAESVSLVAVPPAALVAGAVPTVVPRIVMGRATMPGGSLVSPSVLSEAAAILSVLPWAARLRVLSTGARPTVVSCTVTAATLVVALPTWVPVVTVGPGTALGAAPSIPTEAAAVVPAEAAAVPILLLAPPFGPTAVDARVAMETPAGVAGAAAAFGAVARPAGLAILPAAATTRPAGAAIPAGALAVCATPPAAVSALPSATVRA